MMSKQIVTKKWGEEEWICNTDKYCAKYLSINSGFVCSEHRHPIKDETFHVVAGSGVIELDGFFYLVEPGHTLRVPPRTWHRFSSKDGMTLLEVSTPHSDFDVERRSESHAFTKETDPFLWRLLYE